MSSIVTGIRPIKPNIWHNNEVKNWRLASLTPAKALKQPTQCYDSIIVYLCNLFKSKHAISTGSAVDRFTK